MVGSEFQCIRTASVLSRNRRGLSPSLTSIAHPLFEVRITLHHTTSLLSSLFVLCGNLLPRPNGNSQTLQKLKQRARQADLLISTVHLKTLLGYTTNIFSLSFESIRSCSPQVAAVESALPFSNCPIIKRFNAFFLRPLPAQISDA